MSEIAFSKRFTRLAGPLALALWAGAAAAKSPDLSGVWKVETPAATLRTIDGQEPPLLPDAAAIYRRHLAQRRQGDTSFDSATWCASVGLPRAMLINYPFQIVDRPNYVAFLHEWNWWARTVYLNGSLGDQPKAGQGFSVEQELQGGRVQASDMNGPMGVSVGHRDGDTLVVETDHLLQTTLLDNSGLPHSDALKLTERLRLRGPDTLEDRITVDDPKTFAKPWDTVVTYRRQREAIHEDVCLDRIKAGEPAVRD